MFALKFTFLWQNRIRSQVVGYTNQAHRWTCTSWVCWWLRAFKGRLTFTENQTSFDLWAGKNLCQSKYKVVTNNFGPEQVTLRQTTKIVIETHYIHIDQIWTLFKAVLLLSEL